MAKKKTPDTGSPIPVQDAADVAAEAWERVVEAFQGAGLPETASVLITARLEAYISAKVAAAIAERHQ